jgi:glycine cleavage system transcriptional repressor
LHLRCFSTKQQSLIINAVGTDRLGIVSDMTKEVIDVGGNVGESQAAKLGKHFSLMMLVEVPHDQVDVLQQKLSAMKDLTASVCLTDGSKSTEPSQPTIGYRGQLTLEGADNPGIVYKVTKILSTNGLNIDKMETSDELAVGGGTVLFKMKGIAHAYEPLASGFDVGKIKVELAELGDSLNCDIILEDMAT